MRYFLSKFLLAIFLLLTVSSFLVAAQKNFVSQMKYLKNDTLFRHQYTYDKYGRTLMEVISLQNSNSWKNYELKEWFYTDDKCTSVFEKKWIDNAWENSSSIEYQYEGGVLKEEVYKKYSPTTIPQKKISYIQLSNVVKSKVTSNWQNSTWSIDLEELNSYDLNGKLDTVSINSYKSGVADSRFMLSNRYDEMGRLSSQLLQEKKNDSSLQNISKVDWYYTNHSNQVVSQRTQLWNTEFSAWIYSQRIDYEYSTDNKISSELLQYWHNAYWKETTRYDYFYTTAGNLMKKQELKPIYSLWRTTKEINYQSVDDANLQTIESRYAFWGGTTGEAVTVHIPYLSNDVLHFVKAKSLDVVYVKMDVIDSIDHQRDAIGELITVYPNPSNGFFYFNNQQYNVIHWTIYSLNGTMLLRKDNFDHSGIVDASSLPRGIYLFVANTTNKRYFQKLIKH
jgi:type II secretory pathway component PulJ